MTLDVRARQLPDESVVMRYPTREYQTDQPSNSRPFCSPHTAEKYLAGDLDWPTHISFIC